MGIVMLRGLVSPSVAQCPEQWLLGNGIPGVNGNVEAVIRWDPDGAGPEPEVLVVGGSFTIAGTTTVNRIAVWNGVSWKSLGEGMNSHVYALAVYNGQLIAGGSFSTAGALACNRIARWDGYTWQPLEIGRAHV